MITILASLVGTLFLLNIFLFFVLLFLCQVPGVSFIQGCVSALGLILIFLSVLGLISFWFLRGLCLRLLPANASCEIKPCPFSDHDFVYLSIQSSGNNSRGPGCWKFNNSLLNDRAFCEYITTCIDDLSGCLQHFASVKSWWGFFKRSIRLKIIYFSKNKRRELSHERVLLVNRIIDLKLKLTSGDLSVSSEISELESELKALTLKELDGSRVRSRIQWLEEGKGLLVISLNLSVSALTVIFSLPF